jgi:hypothetical protein
VTKQTGLITSVLVACRLSYPTAFAQHASLGVIGGTSLTDGFGTISTPTQYAGGGAFVYSSGPRNFIVGPELEVRFPWGLSFEVDALHRNLQAGIRFVSFRPGIPPSRVTLLTQTPWEFPLLVKYRLPFLGRHPFFESGVSLRPAGTGTGLSHVGVTAGAGVEIQVRDLHISPVARYTHWEQISSSFVRTDQVELFVGFDWSSSSIRPSAFGRRLSFGALVGMGAGDDFRPASSAFYLEHPESNSLTAGASVEAGLAGRLSLEVDGMYRPLHATDVPVPGYTERRNVRFATLTWEFPVLLKYRFSTPKGRPFIELGPSFRAIGNVEITPPSHYGITGGTGMEFAIGRLKVSPAFRFSRWAPDGPSRYPNAAHAFQNEAQLLLGISF